MLEINKLYQGNCVELLNQVEPKSIDLVITSPPYKEKDGFSYKLMSDTFCKLFAVQKQNSLFFLNFGHLVEEKLRPFFVCDLAMSHGYKLNDSITWLKTQYSPIQGHKRVNNLTEFIFMLYKGKMPKLDRLSIGIPYEDKSNVGRYSEKDLKCRGNLWKFGYETIQRRNQKLHKDRFPEKLPEFCIKLAGLKPGSLVLDPFGGSFTTAFVAKKLGMNFLSFELNPLYFDTCEDRKKFLLNS